MRLAWPLLLLFLPSVGRAEGKIESFGPFVPTPMEVVRAMLELAKVTPKDVVYDLGCGDGRIVVMAAKDFGARGVGVDIDFNRVRESWENVEKAGVSDKVTILLEDAAQVDLWDATVVTLYLLPEANLKLRPKLLSELPVGARVVSHAYHMGSWKPDKVEEVEEAGWGRTIYLWVIKPPAPASGTWVWKDDRGTYTVKIRQIGSAISGSYTGPEGKGLPLEDAFVSGEEIHFVVETERGRKTFEGKVAGDEMEGRISIESKEMKEAWRPRRLPVRASGTWKLNLTLPWGKVTGDLTLEGTKDLSGELQIMGGERFPITGRLFGATASLTVNFLTPLGGAVLKMEGLVDGDKMDGPVRASPFGVKGWFEAERAG